MEHQTGGDGELGFIVPLWSKSERDVGHHVRAVFGDNDGVGRVQVDQVSIAEARRPSAPGREQERGVVGFAEKVQSMVRDRCSNDLVFGADGLPFESKWIGNKLRASAVLLRLLSPIGAK